MLNDIISFLAYSLAGSFLGMITGLIPGFHTNNLALILLSLFSSNDAGIAILISSSAISHTFLNIIPSTFLGMPEEDTALVILPAHSMLLKGMAYHAISISAKASFLSVVSSLLLLLPFKFIIGMPLSIYPAIKNCMFYILLCISIIVIATSSDIKNALFIFLLSGFFGMVISNFPNSIFPSLAGLFGAATIIIAKKEEVPEQNVEEKEYSMNPKDIMGGTIAGALVAILPGVSSGVATTLALSSRREKKEENAISILSSANTATNFFVIATLFILLKARSGFAIVIRHVVGIGKWVYYPPHLFLLILSSILISAIISFYATRIMGKWISGNIHAINYGILLAISLSIITIMVMIFSGITGILIFIVATLIGMICIKMGVRRSNLMGVLLLPLLIYYFPKI